MYTIVRSGRLPAVAFSLVSNLFALLFAASSPKMTQPKFEEGVLSHD